ncbi:hypothetical protein [Roseovarius sp. Pro17]|uniref:hypothetical protein n=1 Tax=Roseovarius sp. Pro17 TaxID=3108175 RepID=UPI002D786C02|nr:hypothetical protein [Roseovarius sp. Pro17]
MVALKIRHQLARPRIVERKADLFLGSQTSGRAAVIASALFKTAKLNSVDPQASSSDTLAFIPGS